MFKILFAGENFIYEEAREFAGNPDIDIITIGMDTLALIDIMEQYEVRCLVLDGISQNNLVLSEFINVVKKINVSCRIIIASNMNDLDLAQDMIVRGADYVLRYPQESTMFQALLARIINRYNKEELSKKIKRRYELNLALSGDTFSLLDDSGLFAREISPLYQMAIVRILPPYRHRFNRKNDDIILLKGREMLWQDFGDFNGCTIIQRGQDFCILMQGTQEELDRYNKQFGVFLKHMDGVSYSYFKIGTWIAFGNVVDDENDILESYRRAEEIMHERMVMKENFGIISYSPDAQKSTHAHLLLSVKHALINAIESFDENDLEQVFVRLKNEIDTTRGVTGSELYGLYREIAAIFFLEFDLINGIEIDNRLTHSFFLKEFDYFWNVEDMFKFLVPVFLENVAEWKRQTENREDVKVRMAKKYINEFYSMPISLEEVSSYVGLNPSYFSDYFKKETGKTFSGYIADVRIKYAKQMLLNDKLSIEDVAESVGYSDKKYFSKVFKRETGLTPGEFRRIS